MYFDNFSPQIRPKDFHFLNAGFCTHSFREHRQHLPFSAKTHAGSFFLSIIYSPSTNISKEIIGLYSKASSQFYRYYHSSKGIYRPGDSCCFHQSFSSVLVFYLFFLSAAFAMPARLLTAFTTFVAAEMMFLFPFKVSATSLTDSLTPSMIPSSF